MSSTPDSKSESKSALKADSKTNGNGRGGGGGGGNGDNGAKESVLYKEFLAEREEILRHKWIESEKAGHDIGFEKALLDWVTSQSSSESQSYRGLADTLPSSPC